LSAAEFALYEEIHRRLAWQAPQPDCVIYLQAPVPVLMQRVARRDRQAERRLQADYMARVVAAYRAFFADYAASRLIVVDTAQFDLVGADTDYGHLLAALDDDEPHIELRKD